MECGLCGEVISGSGNNPYPIVEGKEDDCCDTCNLTEVIPFRQKCYNTAQKIINEDIGRRFINHWFINLHLHGGCDCNDDWGVVSGIRFTFSENTKDERFLIEFPPMLAVQHLDKNFMNRLMRVLKRVFREN